ncbi:MAG: hypothetical protein HMLKMBBP_00891 [Planctomycetes bacterium]|nr:hypothetical protein [Planctomycetota bacterium]
MHTLAAMDPTVSGVIESVLRWLHVVFGILWIGHLFFFNFVNAFFAPTMDGESKKKVVPELMPRALFWFRWGAALTWITGVLLLGLAFYMVPLQTLVPDRPGGEPEWNGFRLAMLAVTFLGVFVYDALMKTALKAPAAQFWGGFVLIAGAVWAFTAAGFTQRGMQIHVGAMLGTMMAFNVWFRIWPAQKQIIAAVKGGTAPEAALVALAGSRSKQNTYMSFALLFLMLNLSHNWMIRSTEGGFNLLPVFTSLSVLVAFGLCAHVYGHAKKVKGF